MKMKCHFILRYLSTLHISPDSFMHDLRTDVGSV